MDYGAASYAGPDASGRTFAAYAFHHFVQWEMEQKRRRVDNACRAVNRRAR